MTRWWPDALHFELPDVHPAGATLAVLVLFGSALVAQTASPMLDADQIVKQIGGEDDAKAVFSLLFAHLRFDKSRELFLSSQIRAEWLPKSDAGQFIRLDDLEAEATLINCGTYWTIKDVRRAGNVVNLSLDSRCGATRLEYTMHYSGGQWRYGPYDPPNGGGWAPGIGSGFANGPPPGCPCLERR